MIKFPAKHLFEAKAPMLEDHEQEIIFTHPSGEFSCNQLGVLYYDEDKYVLLENVNGSYMKTTDRKNLSKGTKLRLVWECYTNEIYPTKHSPHIYQVNANVYDFTRENLILAPTLNKYWQRELNAVRKDFIKKSVEHLIQIEERWDKLGVSKEEVWTMLLIPYWLIGARKRHAGLKKWSSTKIAKKRC